jgi:hypothetical protein
LIGAVSAPGSSGNNLRESEFAEGIGGRFRSKRTSLSIGLVFSDHRDPAQTTIGMFPSRVPGQWTSKFVTVALCGLVKESEQTAVYFSLRFPGFPFQPGITARSGFIPNVTKTTS